jgi:hypothetical protein
MLTLSCKPICSGTGAFDGRLCLHRVRRSRLDKTEFLESNKALPDLLDYHLEQVDVRFFGGTAIVHATGRFTRKDGPKGMTRYTAVYVRTGEDRKAVFCTGHAIS